MLSSGESGLDEEGDKKLKQLCHSPERTGPLLLDSVWDAKEGS